ncbi:unnamed protein product [Scytosiphon promiscuus]
MARLPADGESVQSRSSETVQNVPDIPLQAGVVGKALADAKKQAEQEDKMCAAGNETAESDSLSLIPTGEGPTCDDGAATACKIGMNRTEDEYVNDEKGEINDGYTASSSPVEGSRLITTCTTADDDASGKLAASATADTSHTQSPEDTENATMPRACRHGEQAPRATTAEVVQPYRGSLEQTDTVADDIAESRKACITGASLASQPSTSVQAETDSEACRILSESTTEPGVQVANETQAEPVVVAETEERQRQVATAESLQQIQGREPTADTDGVEDSAMVDRKQREDAFVSATCFTGPRPGYVFKSGDKGLGFYVDGYVDQLTRGALTRSHRPWNAGPGEQANRRGPLGPIPKPFKKIVPFRTRQQRKAAEESDTRPFMARMVAQRNSRAFQSNLFGREHALDSHILQLLEKFSDPTFFKKKHGYNVHGQMLGRDGKMIIKETPEKTEEEKAKLSWYRKVYEDRLGKHLPTKRLGDSIEARREAYAYSRHFTAGLNGREEELNRALTKALKVLLEFITEDYHYPGAYDTDGKVILEKGATISNDLHRTDAQNERACTYRYKAIRRYRAAHDDIMTAISNKDKALQKLLKKTDPTILLEMSEDAVKSSGMGIFRQSRTAVDGSANPSGKGPTERLKEKPEQLRQSFTQRLKVEIKGKDKALQKEIAMLEEYEAEQMVGGYGKCVEVLPGSWREDPESLKRMQKRRKELLEENAADRCKVVCPWRPGGKHIAREAWEPFTPRSHRPPVRSTSERKSETCSVGKGTPATQGGTKSEPDVRKRGIKRRPHTAPTHRRRGFMDAISPRARRILAAQAPGTPLHSAFSTYSTDPFPLETAHHSSPPSVPARTDCPIHDFPASRTKKIFDTSGGVGQGTHQRAWAETSCSSTRPQTLRSRGFIERPQSATVEISKKGHVLPRRPATACGARDIRVCSSNPGVIDCGPKPETVSSTNQSQGQDHESHGGCRDLHVRSGPGVTVLWARLCAPSSDLVYKSSVWPRAHKVSPSRREKSTKTTRTASGDTAKVCDGKGGHRKDLLTGKGFRTSTGIDTIDSNLENADVSGGRAGAGGQLEDLEDSLFSSSSQRVDQRRRVFRGYAERSRREQTWDPGSVFYAEGASEHHITDPRSLYGGRKGVGRVNKSGVPSVRAPTRGSGSSMKEQRSQASTNDHPVDMDWEKVDIASYGDTSSMFQKALDGRLFAVATDDENTGRLRECFREAQELVESASALLGCPRNERERFREQIGRDFGFSSYVTTVSRLNLLWTLACGVIEIVHMMRHRKNLMELFRREQEGLSPSAEFPGSSIKEVGETTRQEWHASLPDSAVKPLRERAFCPYEARLELAEFTVAIAESVKLWISIIPWRVRVLYGGKPVFSCLRAEEEALPWPPDPETLRSLDIESTVVQTQVYGPQNQRCPFDDGEEED